MYILNNILPKKSPSIESQSNAFLKAYIFIYKFLFIPNLDIETRFRVQLLDIHRKPRKTTENFYRLWQTILIASIILLSACSERKPVINIAVASNFEPTLKRIIEKYKTTQTGSEINIISASSGLIANQILNSAPFDLFLSADTSKPQLIFNRLKLKTKPKVYAVGKLALWIPQSSDNNCLQQLPKVKTLAMANPEIAPYGKVAEEILNNNSIIIDKTIHTANAAQAYIYTKDGLTQAGFMPHSLVLNESKGCLQVFENKELSQSMVLLNHKAKDFYRFMHSANIQELIRESGYQLY